MPNRESRCDQQRMACKSLGSRMPRGAQMGRGCEVWAPLHGAWSSTFQTARFRNRKRPQLFPRPRRGRQDGRMAGLNQTGSQLGIYMQWRGRWRSDCWVRNICIPKSLTRRCGPSHVTLTPWLHLPPSPWNILRVLVSKKPHGTSEQGPVFLLHSIDPSPTDICKPHPSQMPPIIRDLVSLHMGGWHSTIMDQ